MTLFHWLQSHKFSNTPHYITSSDTLPATCSSVCGWRPPSEFRTAGVVLFECAASWNLSVGEFRAENPGSLMCSQSTVLRGSSVCLSCHQMTFVGLLSLCVCVFCFVSPVSWPHPLTLSPSRLTQTTPALTRSSSPAGRRQLITTCYIGSVPCRRSTCISCGFEREPAIFNVGFLMLTFRPAAKSKLLFVNTVLHHNVFFFTTYSHTHICLMTFSVHLCGYLLQRLVGLLLLGDTITLYCQGWYTNKL